MRARFINEIKRDKEGSGLGSIGIGRAAIIDVPSLLKKLVKPWEGKYFMYNTGDAIMNGTYKKEDEMHILTFDFSYIDTVKNRIDNPTIIYNEKKFKLNISFGGVKRHWKSKEFDSIELDLYNEDDINQTLDGLDPHTGWVSIMYDNLIGCIKDFGNAYEEKESDGPPRYNSYGYDYGYFK